MWWENFKYYFKKFLMFLAEFELMFVNVPHVKKGISLIIRCRILYMSTRSILLFELFKPVFADLFLFCFMCWSARSTSDWERYVEISYSDGLIWFLWHSNCIYLDLSQHLDNLKLFNYVVTFLFLMMLLKHKANLPDIKIYLFTYEYICRYVCMYFHPFIFIFSESLCFW